MPEQKTRGWALVLGASSGLGAACSVALAREGHDIFGVHLGAKDPEGARRVVADVEAAGRQAIFRKGNAADDDVREAVLDELEAALEDANGKVTVVVHSLALAVLTPFVAKEGPTLDRAELALTMDVMAHSLVFWMQALASRKMLARGAHVFAMTSAGSHRIAPGYGAVSAAKAALEAHVRQLAMELAPSGVTVVALQAGVTDTPAFRKIPGAERILEEAKRVHPEGRITTPEDVGRAVVALSQQKLDWITGTVIRVDGGEDNF